jgi:hypothetical protein
MITKRSASVGVGFSAMGHLPFFGGRANAGRVSRAAKANEQWPDDNRTRHQPEQPTIANNEANNRECKNMDSQKSVIASSDPALAAICGHSQCLLGVELSHESGPLSDLAARGLRSDRRAVHVDRHPLQRPRLEAPLQMGHQSPNGTRKGGCVRGLAQEGRALTSRHLLALGGARELQVLHRDGCFAIDVIEADP